MVQITADPSAKFSTAIAIVVIALFAVVKITLFGVAAFKRRQIRARQFRGHSVRDTNFFEAALAQPPAAHLGPGTADESVDRHADGMLKTLLSTTDHRAVLTTTSHKKRQASPKRSDRGVPQY
jgi:hypothetical protein